MLAVAAIGDRACLRVGPVAYGENKMLNIYRRQRHMEARRKLRVIAETIAIGALIVTAGGAVLVTIATAGSPTANAAESRSHIERGIATHVGHAYYPWQETAALRQHWGQMDELPAWWRPERSCALHSAMYDDSLFGAVVWVRSLESRRLVTCIAIDAMAAGDGHPDPQYHGRVIDLTPQLMDWLDEGPMGGGEQVEIRIWKKAA